MNDPSARDLFVVHTRGDSRQVRLYESLTAWCQRVGLRIVTYDDWEWEAPNDPPPDMLGQLPKDPWYYMPDVTSGTLHEFWRRCDVVLVIESGPEDKHSYGVGIELTELLRFVPTTPPPAIVVTTSFGPIPSDELRGLGAPFFELSSLDETGLYSLVAVAWLVSRLQRSGHPGLRILDPAQRSSAIINRFVWFGAFWAELQIDRMKWGSPIDSWWPDAASLHAFMTSEGTGRMCTAWRILADAIKAHLSK